MFSSNPRYRIIEEDRELLDYLPPVSILLGGIIFLTGTFLAIFQYQTPNGGFNFFEQFFSELGIRHNYLETLADGSTEQRYAPQNPEIFNLTLYASGILMVPFFSFSYRQMRNHSVISNILLSFAITAGILSGISLIFVGIFDLSHNNQGLLDNHGFWVASLYILITFTSICWLLMLFSSKHLPYRTTKWIILDLVLLVGLVFFALLNIIDGLGKVRAQEIPFINQYKIELYQKLIAYLFFIYYGLVVGVRLTKTKYDNTPVHKDDPAIFCTNCGKENPPDAPFCTECGVKIS